MGSSNHLFRVPWHLFSFVGQMGRINAAPDSPESNSSEQGSLLTEIAEDIKIVTIVEGLIGARGIAVQPNGQTIFVTNSISGEILAYDASESTRAGLRFLLLLRKMT